MCELRVYNHMKYSQQSYICLQSAEFSCASDFYLIILANVLVPSEKNSWLQFLKQLVTGEL